MNRAFDVARLAVRTVALSAMTLQPFSAALAQSSDLSEEVIVTARKREEESLRVPVVASVLQNEEMDRRQVNDLFDVATLTPGLLLGASSIEVGTEISLRGVGASLLDPGIDQSVALNLDGLQLGQGAAYSVGVFDMERIEILKGPQPLFFGKNSPGGVVAIRSADPGKRFELIGREAYESGAEEWRTDVILSGPVSDTLGLRLASQLISADGYFRNTAVALPETGGRQPDDHIGQKRSHYHRLTALYRPGETITARLKLNATHDRVLGGVPAQLVYCPDGTHNYLPDVGLAVPSLFSPNENCRADRNVNTVDLDPGSFAGVPNDGVGFTDTDQRFGTLEMNWTIAPHLTLTSLTGYYDLDLDGLQNGPWAGGAAPPLSVTKVFGREEASQEFRFNAELGAFGFTSGAFFQDATIKSETTVPGNRAYGFPATVLRGSHDVDISSVALFAQLRFRPVQTVEIAGGVRWTDEERSDHAVIYDVTGAHTGVQDAAMAAPLPRLHSSNESPELTASWWPNQNLTLFASLKQGYKSGSYNINFPLNPGEDNSFGDERGRGGEIGLKGYTGSRELFFDLAAYRYMYTGLQVGLVQVRASGIPGLKTFNAGEAEVYGVDFALRYQPSRVQGLSLSGAMNWNHGRFTRFVNAPCFPGQTIAEGCNLQPSLVTDPAEIEAGYYTIDPVQGLPVRYNGQDLSGTRLPRAPSVQANFNVDYETAVGARLELGVGAGLQYSSDYLVDLGRRQHGDQGDFTKLFANVRLKTQDDRWEVALIGNNLTGELTTGGCFDVNYPAGAVFPGMISGAPIRGPAGSGEILCAYGQGREVWLRLTARPFNH
jgi:outer membrane receptor protein involved in Fe transport